MFIDMVRTWGYRFPPMVLRLRSAGQRHTPRDWWKGQSRLFMRFTVFVLSELFFPGKIKLSPPSNVRTPTTQFRRGSVAANPGLGGTRSSYSWVYRVQASPSCFMLLRHAMPCALVLA